MPLVAVPPGVVTRIGPEVAPFGTVARSSPGASEVTAAGVPLNETVTGATNSGGPWRAELRTLRVRGDGDGFAGPVEIGIFLPPNKASTVLAQDTFNLPANTTLSTVLTVTDNGLVG